MHLLTDFIFLKGVQKGDSFKWSQWDDHKCLVVTLFSLFLHQDGLISVKDIDLVMSEGLGMRYAFIGPMETMHLNAPEGNLSSLDFSLRQTEGQRPTYLWHLTIFHLTDRKVKRKKDRTGDKRLGQREDRTHSWWWKGAQWFLMQFLINTLKTNWKQTENTLTQTYMDFL